MKGPRAKGGCCSKLLSAWYSYETWSSFPHVIDTTQSYTMEVRKIQIRTSYHAPTAQIPCPSLSVSFCRNSLASNYIFRPYFSPQMLLLMQPGLRALFSILWKTKALHLHAVVLVLFWWSLFVPSEIAPA